MRELFKTNTKKFWYWHLVEITVLAVSADKGSISKEDYKEIVERTWVDDLVAHAIERRDKLINHDLNAFIEIIRLQILLPRIRNP
jgi:adenylosuccinate lyase